MDIKKRREKPAKFEILASNIPSELKNSDRWVCWRWTWKGRKWDKPPCKPDGTGASTREKSTWTTFARAIEGAKALDGIGYVMSTELGLVGVDIDGCRNPVTGEIAAPAQQIIDDLATYTEVSPSGTGVKMWLRGSFDRTKWKNKSTVGGCDVEVYSDGRYFTVTGHKLTGVGEIATAGDAFDVFLSMYFARDDFSKLGSKDRSEINVEETLQRMQDAIKFIDPDCGYHKWIAIGMAIAWVDQGPNGFRIWDEWSKGAAEVYPGEAKLQAHWLSFPGAGGDITAGTLFFHAAEAGWTPPKPVYDRTELGMARRFTDEHRGKIYYVPQWDRWMVWDGTRFVESAKDGIVLDMIAQCAVDARDNEPTEFDPKVAKKIADFYEKLQSCRGLTSVEKLSRQYATIDYRKFNENPLLFGCANGVLNLEDCSLVPHDPSNLITMVAGVEYDAREDCPRWKQFIREITCGDEDLARYLQQIAGYLLCGLVDAQSLFVLHGDGANGKSVFLRTILKVLGPYGGPVNQSLLMASPNQHPTQFAYLYGKRGVVAQETDQDCRLNEAQVKELTGSDEIQCRRMREDFWSFRPTHKLLLATNHLPTIRGTDRGVWRRVKLIPFAAKFEGAAIDPYLDQKLSEELPGILTWMLDGWSDYQLDGFVEPDCVRHARDEYRAEMNVVLQFIEDECDLGEEHRTTGSALYQALKLYCELNGRHVPSFRAVEIELKKLGIRSERDKRARYKVGIRLRPDLAD